MSLNRRLKRLEVAALTPVVASSRGKAGCVVIYTGRDERGQPIRKDAGSRAAIAGPGHKFFMPDNWR